VRAVFLALFSFMVLWAQNPKNMSLVELFKNGYYSYICTHRWEYINRYHNKREDLLSLVAYACLKKHRLTPALDLAKTLRMTKEGRVNATYIDTLFMMKQLLIQYLNGEKVTKDVKLPLIKNDLLAKVFYLVQIQQPEVTNQTLEVTDRGYRYVVKYLPKINNIEIKTYKDGKLISKDVYW